MDNNAVTVDSSGNYYIYLDLQKGRNIIEVKTITGIETKTNDINIFFTPPLTVRVGLTQTSFDPSTIFKIPTPVMGVVSDSMAEVEVNGVKVKVNSDGTFNSQMLQVVGGNSVNATAQLGNEVDEDESHWNLADNGRIKIVSGFLTFPVMLPTMTIDAGESSSFDFSLQFDKTIPDTSVNSISITRMAGLNNVSNNLAMLPELKVTIEPSIYTTYPKIVYKSQVTIDTLATLPPGDYYFYVNSSLGQGALFQQSGYHTSYLLNQGPNSSEGAQFEVIVN